MSEERQKIGRRGRAWLAFAGGALLVLSPLRVTWANEASGLLGPFVMWVALAGVVAATLRGAER